MKWLALLFMTLDHFALYFDGHIPHLLWFVCRAVGRLAFPMFAYLLVLGYRRTRSLTKYFIRLAVFALLTQGAMTLTAKLTGSFVFTNVLYTLAAGLILVLGYDFLTKSISDLVARLRPAGGDETAERPDYGVRINIKGISLPTRTGLIIGILLCVLSIVLVWLMKPDYSYYGLMIILLLHIMEDITDPLTPHLNENLKKRKTMLFFKVLLMLSVIWVLVNFIFYRQHMEFKLLNLISAYAVFLFPLESRSQRPKPVMKYFFYIYYPVHLCLFMFLSSLV
ncbi:MAG TPA: hypothetical protein GX717_02900 [Clostridiaceae bacterium]|nr:hypothetical protein [Clostridiaceae bacterium]